MAVLGRICSNEQYLNVSLFSNISPWSVDLCFSSLILKKCNGYNADKTADQSCEMSWFCKSVSIKVFFHKICNGIVFKMCIKMLYGNTNNDAHVKMAVVKACLVHPDWRVSWSIIRKGDACLSPLRLQPGQCVKFQAAATMKRWQWAVNSNTRLQMLLQKNPTRLTAQMVLHVFFYCPTRCSESDLWPAWRGEAIKKKHEILCRV